MGMPTKTVCMLVIERTYNNVIREVIRDVNQIKSSKISPHKKKKTVTLNSEILYSTEYDYERKKGSEKDGRDI